MRGVILPSWVEHQPRRLLKAVAAGIPVFASRYCGLEGVEGVTIVDSFSDFDGLSLAGPLSGVLGNNATPKYPEQSSTAW